MDAPTYPPATVFVMPERLPRTLSVSETSIKALKVNPAAWAIVEREIPGMDRRVGGEQLRPHLDNFSLESLLPFGVVSRDALDRVEVQLRALGQSK